MTDPVHRGRGAVQRWTRTLIPTAREAPADAETPSHVLLHRAGCIRPVGAGIYDYLPLATRVLRKISGIIRDEMDAAGAAELLLPALEPIELFKDTRRDADYGDNLFKLQDRRGRTCALAPTHEEVLTDLLRGAVTSYRQLPLSLYQIQTKFRDEARPRAGLLRCREFLMKDAYSFHLGLDGPGGLNETYDAMHRAYTAIFRRCGLAFSAVEAESGPIGGSASHEFMVHCDSGEDTILRCPVSGYAANVEKCEIGERPADLGPASGPDLAVHHTPGMPGIEPVAAHLRLRHDAMLKTIVFRAAPGAPAGAPEWVLAVVRGDHEANPGKVKSAAGVAVTLADEKAARAAGFTIGYVSPRAALSIPRCLVVVDADAARPGPWATGADKPDHHATGFLWRRDLAPLTDDPARLRIGDIRNAAAGDPSPRARGALLEASRGIEVGHIFKLGSKYSEAMGFAVLDEQQQRRSVIMGCYGIGVSRTMAACVEMSHDADGIIWPAAIAPYHVVVSLIKPADPAHADLADRLAQGLAERGADVLIDDRDERAGVKFKDADMIGIPVRLTIGDKALAQGAVEFKLRRGGGKGDLVPVDQAVARCLEAIRG